MKQAQFEVERIYGPATVSGWRLSEHFGAHASDDGYWTLTHLPTRRRVSRHRSLEACLASAERLEQRCGEALASTDIVAVAWAISPAAARKGGVSKPTAREEAAA